MLGLGVQHQVHHVFGGTVHTGYGINLLEAGMASLGDGRLNSRCHLCAGLPRAIIGQLTGLGGHGNIHSLGVDRLCLTIDLDSLDDVCLTTLVFQSLHACLQCFVSCFLAICQVLKVTQFRNMR